MALTRTDETMTRRQRILTFIGLTISAAFLWTAFTRLNPTEVLGYLRAANPLIIAFAAVWYFSAVLVISLRWRFLLRPSWREPASDGVPPTAPSPRHLMGLVSVGYMGNNVFPLRAGEVLRIALTQRDFGIPFARITTTVLVERILDGIVMLTFILVALVFGGLPAAEAIRPVAIFAAPVFVVALGVFFYFALHPDQLRRLVTAVSGRLPQRLSAPILRLSGDAIDGLTALRTPADALGAIVFSYGSWMLEATVYYLVAIAFALPVDYLTMLLVVGVVNLAGLIPASPGQFGVYEFFVITILTAVGVAESQAITYAFSVHLVIWLPVTLVGFYILWRRGLGWNLLRSARELEGQNTA
ncbi:MAG: hypothetical protein CUN53_04760 [Phototrophicales bacterium]|nr:MAG: hypothetical protein CUN53_04760 [Phototrophicales bacterium]